MSSSRKTLIIVLSSCLILCFCWVVCLGGAYAGLRYLEQTLPTAMASIIPSDLILPPSPTPTLLAIPTRSSDDGAPEETLRLLKNTQVPEANLPDIACRLRGVCDVPLSAESPEPPLSIGAKDTFWVINTDTNRDFQVTAILRYITPHLYFWVEEGARFDEKEVKNLCETFEAKIYPTNREFFGSEWTPGVDNDPHIYILYVGGIGFNTAGYYSSQDEYPPSIREHSNAHEMFVINTTQDLGDEYTYSILAHEFQHMIHWHQDRNESELLDEGFSELASFLNGYDIGGFDWLYTTSPDINLTDWLPNVGDNSKHYGANFLFVNYFLNRFGEKATRALVKHPANGLDSVDAVLAELGFTTNGQPITADDFFQDWTIANFLNDAYVEDGRYFYQNYRSAPTAQPTETFSVCPASPFSRTVNQYGVDYIQVVCPGEHTIFFQGSPVTRLLPVNPRSGQYAFWSNKGNQSDMTLTRAFDFSDVSGEIDLFFWTWYDIEADYDYLYLEASTDGKYWQILETPSGTGENPTGSSFGWAYNGTSEGWIQEKIDLSQFAGQKIWLRFEYITDAAVNGDGFLLDDVSIPAIDYFSDFEADDGGWEASGFARVQNILPQTFRLALIVRSDTKTEVQKIALTPENTAEIPITIGSKEKVILVVSGTTRFTRDIATYQIEIR